MTRNQFLGTVAATTVLVAVGWRLSRPRPRPELPRRVAVERRLDQVRPSDTPQKSSDTPQRRSDTPQRASDTPQRLASDTPQKAASDTPQRVAAPRPAFSCADARELALRGLSVMRLRSGLAWPVPRQAKALLFDEELGEPLGFVVEEPGGSAAWDLWLNRAGAFTGGVPSRRSPGALPALGLSALGDPALARALRSAYPPALRRLGGRPAPVPAQVPLMRPDLLGGSPLPRPARRGSVACLFAAPGRRDVVMAEDGQAVAAWPEMTAALYEQAADVLDLPR